MTLHEHVDPLVNSDRNRNKGCTEWPWYVAFASLVEDGTPGIFTAVFREMSSQQAAQMDRFGASTPDIPALCLLKHFDPAAVAMAVLMGRPVLMLMLSSVGKGTNSAKTSQSNEQLLGSLPRGRLTV